METKLSDNAENNTVSSMKNTMPQHRVVDFSSQRKQSIYLLVDISGSMCGDAIESVNVSLQSILSVLNNTDNTLSWYLSLILFHQTSEEKIPLTALSDISIPTIESVPSTASFLGTALQKLLDNIEENYYSNQDNNNLPLLLIFTDGKLTDIAIFQKVITQIRNEYFHKIIICIAGTIINDYLLKQFADRVVSLDTMGKMEFQRLLCDDLEYGE